MEAKTYIWIGILVGGIAGGAIGGLFDHGNMLGGWSIFISTIGSIVGIWAGWKLSQ